jgi:hypothetical protein
MVLISVLAACALCWSGRLRAAGSTNGSGGDMPAFYDDQLFTINFKELSGAAEGAQLAHNGSINTIWMCDECEADGYTFVSVIDAIQGDGFNPLWREVQISFNDGFEPRQLTSDTDVEAAADAGEITLVPTDEIYRCSVVGSK